MLRTLGVGGMGEVFLAERADAEFDQRVAIKVVYGGSLTHAVQSRLKIERQILAQLDHPNIAHLLDGDSLVEFRVRALREEYLSHAAHPQGAQHAIRPYAVAFHG